jgi:hypothetical protein
MITNLDRANWADKAILAFREETYCDHEESLGDLLCDLMHWADARNFDFDTALDRARHNHQEERDEESPTACPSEIIRDLIDSKNAANTLNVAEAAIYANLSALSEQLADGTETLTDKPVAAAPMRAPRTGPESKRVLGKTKARADRRADDDDI